MHFDPKEYWQNRPNPNAVGHDEAPNMILDFLRTGVMNKANVLELGPGVGRTFSVYHPSQEIATLDISTRYDNSVRDRANKLGLNVKQYYLENLESYFPFKDKFFSASVCCQVLMHIPNKHISHTLSELLRVSDTVHIVTVKIKPGSAPHVFNHDYDHLFKLQAAKTIYKNNVGDVLFFTLQGC